MKDLKKKNPSLIGLPEHAVLPLVSVMMPCFNAGASLPWALASLQSQTYTHWECIIVDDGSTDDSVDVVMAVNDSRVRLIRFPENRGRPTARQAALDAAQGKYLAMLDADDWIYPEKLALQVEALEQHPEIPVISAGMMILDKEGQPTGVRYCGPNAGINVFPAFRRLTRLPIAHGPSMLRMDAVKDVAYDTALPLGQDTDFLLRVMFGKPYAILGEVLYVYTEYESVTEDKILKSLACAPHVYWKYRKTHPISTLLQLLGVFGKMLIYRLAFGLGLHEAMLRRRSISPSQENLQNYFIARAIVAKYV